MTSSGKLCLERQYKGDAAHGTAGCEKGDARVGHVRPGIVGIDWGSAEHAALSARCARAGRAASGAVAHTAAAVHEAMQWVREQTGVAPEAIAVGIETPRGVLVDTLIEQGFRGLRAQSETARSVSRSVYGRAARKTTGAMRTRSPMRLRTDAARFDAVRADDPPIIQLRELCRLVEELQEQERRLDQSACASSSIASTRAWLDAEPGGRRAVAVDACCARRPHPAAWAQLPRRRIAPALRAHRIRRLTADDVIAALRQPRLTVAPGVADAVAMRIASLVPQLLLVHEQRTDGGTRRSIGCWTARARPTPTEASRASIVTSRFSGPCQVSEEW